MLIKVMLCWVLEQDRSGWPRQDILFSAWCMVGFLFLFLNSLRGTRSLSACSPADSPCRPQLLPSISSPLQLNTSLPNSQLQVAQTLKKVCCLIKISLESGGFRVSLATWQYQQGTSSFLPVRTLSSSWLSLLACFLWPKMALGKD